LIIVSLGVSDNNTNEDRLDLYKRHFEAPFIEAARIYYANESRQIISNSPITEYMKKVNL
jgi:cullin 1